MYDGRDILLREKLSELSRRGKERSELIRLSQRPFRGHKKSRHFLIYAFRANVSGVKFQDWAICPVLGE